MTATGIDPFSGAGQYQKCPKEGVPKDTVGVSDSLDNSKTLTI